MSESDLTLGRLVNLVLSGADIARAAFITSPSTGNPAREELDTLVPQELMLVQYDGVDRLQHLVGAHRAHFDVVITDPFHTYESSQHCLDVCLDLLRPGGLLLCHDCVPPPEYVTVHPVDREWSGLTFAAFRDVMTRRRVSWCTLDVDFGIGVAIAPARGDSREQDRPASHDGWSLERHDEYLNRYLTDPFGFMQTVEAERWADAIASLRRTADITDLAASFESWDRLLPPPMRNHLTQLELDARNAERSRSARLLAHLAAMLRRAADRLAPPSR